MARCVLEYKLALTSPALFLFLFLFCVFFCCVSVFSWLPPFLFFSFFLSVTLPGRAHADCCCI